jgi:hypothetical protein
MKILENLDSKKTGRKNFIIYSGIALMGIYALIKMPFKFLANKEKERAGESISKDSMLRANPESIKRS